MTLQPEQLEEMLGPRRFWRDEVRQVNQPGVATGLGQLDVEFYQIFNAKDAKGDAKNAEGLEEDVE